MFKLPRALSLRTKLILLSLVVEVVMLTLLVFNSVRLSQDSLIAQAQLRYTELNTLFNAALAAPLAQRDYATLNEILAESLNEQGIVYAVLVDRGDHVVASAGWNKDRPLPQASHATFSPTSANYFNANTQILLARQRYGTLHYGVSTLFLKDARAHLIRQSLLIAGGEIFLSTLLLAHWGSG